MPAMFLGLRTVIYPSPDLAAAQAWYTNLLDAEPYFTEHTKVQDVGDGIRTAAVRDAGGNVLGIIENPHFVLP